MKKIMVILLAFSLQSAQGCSSLLYFLKKLMPHGTPYLIEEMKKIEGCHEMDDEQEESHEDDINNNDITVGYDEPKLSPQELEDLRVQAVAARNAIVTDWKNGKIPREQMEGSLIMTAALYHVCLPPDVVQEIFPFIHFKTPSNH